MKILLSILLLFSLCIFRVNAQLVLRTNIVYWSDGGWIYDVGDSTEFPSSGPFPHVHIVAGSGWTPGIYNTYSYYPDYPGVGGHNMLAIYANLNPILPTPASPGTTGGIGWITGDNVDTSIWWNIICVGNSLTYGSGAGNPVSWPNQIQAILTDTNDTYQFDNLGIAGWTWIDMSNAYQANVQSLLNSTNRNVITAWEGHNDLAVVSPTQTFIDTSNYCYRAHTNGFKVILIDTIDGVPDGGFTYNTRTNYNAMLRSNFTVATSNPHIWYPNVGVTWADVFLDLESESWFGTNNAYLDTTVYWSDQTHLTEQGYYMIATNITSAIKLVNFAGNVYNWTNTAQLNSTGYQTGDTINLWGTFVNNSLIITNSGVTFHFEPGASFTAPYWPTTGAIEIRSGISNIIIDGGLIIATDNGTVADNQINSVGIFCDGFIDGLTIQNITITNIYHYVGPNDHSQSGTIISTDASHVTLSNCVLSDGFSLFNWGGGTGTPNATNIIIISNTFLNYTHAVQIGSGSYTGPYLVTNIIISGNYFDHSDVWDDGGVKDHLNAIFIFNNTYDPTFIFARILIFDNVFGPHVGVHTTSATFIETYSPDYQQPLYFMFNNVLYMGVNNSWSDGVGAAGSNTWVFNNTIVGTVSNGVQWGCQIGIGGLSGHIYNNLLLNGSGFTFAAWSPITNNSSQSVSNDLFIVSNYFTDMWSDYNIISDDGSLGNGSSYELTLKNTNAGTTWQSGTFDAGTNGFWGWQTWNYAGGDLQSWSQLHCDPHSSITPPVFVTGSYVPAQTDIVARKKGTNLTFLASLYNIPQLTNDINGNPRPLTEEWDIGAYQATNSPTTYLNSIITRYGTILSE